MVSGTLYTAAARRRLNDALDFIAWIARIILSVQGRNSRSGCCGIVEMVESGVVLAQCAIQWWGTLVAVEV